MLIEKCGRELIYLYSKDRELNLRFQISNLRLQTPVLQTSDENLRLESHDTEGVFKIKSNSLWYIFSKKRVG